MAPELLYFVLSSIKFPIFITRFASIGFAVQHQEEIDDVAAALRQSLRLAPHYLTDPGLIFYAGVALMGILGTIISIIWVNQLSRQVKNIEPAQDENLPPENNGIRKFWAQAVRVVGLISKRKA